MTHTLETSDNIVFIYLPFAVERSRSDFANNLERSGWHEVDISTRYLYPYVCRPHDSAGSLWQRYSKELDTREFEIAPDGSQKSEKARRRYAKREAEYRVLLEDISCYLFSSGINIISFELKLSSNHDSKDSPYLGNPFEVASILHWLHCIGAGDNNGMLSEGNRIRPLKPYGVLNEDRGQTLIEIAHAHLSSSTDMSIKLCPFMAAGRERANVLVYVQCDSRSENQSQAGKESQITYLANLWNETFSYSHMMEIVPSTYYASPEILWGISNEALACIAYPHARIKFLKSAFASNIRNDYQLFYVLLLHQKYAYQTWLNELDSDTWYSIERLEAYKKKLEAFHADYVYARVSDMPQYQVLYEKTYDHLGLAEMEADIREPLDQLARLQREIRAKRIKEREEALRQQRAEEKRLANEKALEEKRREDKLNFAMNILALLAAVSAIVDGHQAIQDLCKWLDLESATAWATACYVLVIIIITANIIKALYDSNKR